MINLDALESAARAATPVAWIATWMTDQGNTLTCLGLSENEVLRYAKSGPATPLYATDPATVLALCRIARAAIVRHKADEALQMAEDDASPDAYFSALKDHNKAWAAEADALRDAGLL